MTNSFLNEPADSAKKRGMRLTIVRIMCGCRTVKEFCEFAESNLITKTFVAWENGRNTGISQKGLRKVLQRAESLGVYASFNWVMYGIGNPPTYDQATTPEDKEQEKEAAVIANELLPFVRNKFTAELTLANDNMAPEYIAGDLVAGTKLSTLNEAIGLTCIVQLSSGEIMLVQVEKHFEKNRFLLKNNKEMFEAHLKMAAPVLFRRRKKENLRAVL